jgi:gluconolactonase
MQLRFFVALSLFVLASRGVSAAEKELPPKISGVYRAAAVKDSPEFTASGIVWWRDRLIISDRVSKRLVSYTPGKGFATYKELTHPVGVAVDRENRLIVCEKEKGVLNRIARFDALGKEETLAQGDSVGTPHFPVVHKSGVIIWTGFPDGGTRSMLPGKEPVVHTPRIVHTYGIALTPQQDFVYVASKIPNKDRRGVWRFPIDESGKLGVGSEYLFVEKLSPKVEGLPAPKDGDPTLLGWVGRLQGITTDSQGNLYLAGAESHNSGEAVAVISPDGKQVIAMILGVPRNISNIAFGGNDGRTLYITGAGEYPLYEVQLPVPGVLQK